MPIKTRGRPKKARPTPETLSKDRSIAPRLIAERTKRGWSQRDLASAADLWRQLLRLPHYNVENTKAIITTLGGKVE
jgi:ribosome-binding protein aMBF1 (putative translation factor)